MVASRPAPVKTLVWDQGLAPLLMVSSVIRWLERRGGVVAGVGESGRALHDAHLNDDDAVVKMGHPG